MGEDYINSIFNYPESQPVYQEEEAEDEAEDEDVIFLFFADENVIFTGGLF